MGLFKKQSIRLMREDWGSPKELAEEVYAILNSDEPIEIDSPVTITNTTNSPPLTLRQFGGTDNGIRIEKYPEPPGEFDDVPPLEFPDDVGLEILTLIGTDGTIETGTGDPTDDDDPTTVAIESGGGGGFPGKIISGSGSSYQVDVYEDGLTESPTRRTVTQLQIDSSETIPANTWALVGKIGDEYFMAVPVWLEE